MRLESCLVSFSGYLFSLKLLSCVAYLLRETFDVSLLYGIFAYENKNERTKSHILVVIHCVHIGYTCHFHSPEQRTGTEKN